MNADSQGAVHHAAGYAHIIGAARRDTASTIQLARLVSSTLSAALSPNQRLFAGPAAQAGWLRLQLSSTWQTVQLFTLAGNST